MVSTTILSATNALLYLTVFGIANNQTRNRLNIVLLTRELGTLGHVHIITFGTHKSQLLRFLIPSLSNSQPEAPLSFFSGTVLLP